MAYGGTELKSYGIKESRLGGYGRGTGAGSYGRRANRFVAGYDGSDAGGGQGAYNRALGFLPAIPMAISTGSTILHSVGGIFGGGANPSLRPQHKALVDFLAAAGDTGGLQYILSATFAGSSQKLYPTATLNYATQMMAAAATPGSVTKATLAPLVTAFNNAPQGTGAPYNQWEINRIQSDYNAAPDSAAMTPTSGISITPGAGMVGSTTTGAGNAPSGSGGPALAGVLGNVNLKTLGIAAVAIFVLPKLLKGRN